MPETQAEISVRKEGSVYLVEFKDRKILEELQIQQIGDQLAQIARADPTARVLLDFANVQHLSSAALGMLINLNQQLAQGKLALANIHPQIYEVFKITRLDRLFNIRSSTEDALKVLA